MIYLALFINSAIIIFTVNNDDEAFIFIDKTLLSWGI